MKIASLLQVGLVFLMGFPLGCTRLPKRDPQVHFSYFPDPPPPPVELHAIPSVYLDLAENHPDKHHLMLLEIGDDALLARIHMIRAATEEIDIQTFIWKDDDVTRVIFNELLEAAKRGVKVRILVDALNSITGNTRLAQMATAHPNLEFAVFRPLSYYSEPGHINKLESLLMKMRRLNRRMHNKLILIDDKIGIIGGRNYENRYFDRNPGMIFKDRDVLVIGPSTLHMDRMFEDFWDHQDSVYVTQFKDVQARLRQERGDGFNFLEEGDQETMREILLLANDHNPGLHRAGMQIDHVHQTEFFWDTPDKFHFGKNSHENRYGEKMREVIKDADDHILLQSPYLIYHRSRKKLVKHLREKNPEISIWFSSNSLAAADHEVVYGVSFKNRKKLYKGLGLEIFEFRPYPKDLLNFVPRYPELSGLTKEEVEKDLSQKIPLELFLRGPKLTIHAKSFVVDDEYTQIGSHNFDPRSNSLNTECGLLIDDEAFSIRVRDQILLETKAGNSWMVAKRDKNKNVITWMDGFMGGLSNLLPIFDIWPYTYTSNFDLKSSYEPLPSSRHPNFYEHYEDVGQFPMVQSALGTIRARLMKSFGGWTGPFM